MDFISRIHTYVRGSRGIRRHARLRPHDTASGTHKEYPRMPRIPLPRPSELSMTLSDALSLRSSFDAARAERAFSAEEVGTLLGSAFGVREKHPHRNYPSGGALFPVETYLVGNVLEEFPSSVFHYHPKAHALEHLWETPDAFAMSKLIRSSVTPLSNAILLFTSVWDRSAAKYGDFAYSHALLEAGHMAQNIVLAATAMGVDARPAAGCDDAYVHELLDIGTEEQHIYAIVIAPQP